MCLPRPDSPPVFGRLLDPDGGHFAITSPMASAQPSHRQNYIPNTNILTTTVALTNGDAFQITDVCPRFEQYGRIYRPPALFSPCFAGCEMAPFETGRTIPVMMRR